MPRGYIDGALAGGAPVFEWVHCDSLGQNMPCEVRFVRLPSSNRRLIRASITDITERKRGEAIAAGERRVFEKIAANAPLSAALEAICEVIERVMAGGFCAINLFDAGAAGALSFGVAPSLPRAVRRRHGPRADRHPLRLLRRRRLSVAPGDRGRHRDRRAVGISARGRAARGLARRLVGAHRRLGRPGGRHLRGLSAPARRAARPAITS